MGKFTSKPQRSESKKSESKNAPADFLRLPHS
jgi:hypothetical protein